MDRPKKKCIDALEINPCCCITMFGCISKGNPDVAIFYCLGPISFFWPLFPLSNRSKKRHYLFFGFSIWVVWSGWAWIHLFSRQKYLKQWWWVYMPFQHRNWRQVQHDWFLAQEDQEHVSCDRHSRNLLGQTAFVCGQDCQEHVRWGYLSES